MKKMMWLFSILAFLFLGNIANAETDLLNLGSYNEGDTPSYGENVVVGQNETTAVKWITGAENASGNLKRLKYSTSLSEDFELFVKTDISNQGMEIFLIANDEYKIKLEIYSSWGYIYADGKKAVKDESDAWTHKINQVKLKVVNNVAKLYVNDVFSTKITLKPDLTYTQMLVNIQSSNDQLYELTTSGTANGNVTPTTGETQTSRPTSASDIPSNILLGKEFDKGKKEGIQQCVDNPGSCGITVSDSSISCPTTNSGNGIQLPTIAPNLNLHIPTIEYQSLGGKMNLWVDLQFTTTDDGKMWWILDDYGVNP